MISFNMGVPSCFDTIIVEGYGLCQMRKFYENGDVLLYMGGNRSFRVSGKNLWRYARF
jgi:hypothetical protein